MKTIEEILENYSKYQLPLDDRFGRRFSDFLTQEQGEKICFVPSDGYEWPAPKEWTRENILAQLEKDVAFGFEKAIDQRAISSGLMFEVVRRWNMVLEEGLENYDENNYAQYGLPLFKATAVKYGFDNPIGEDSGRESKYA